MSIKFEEGMLVAYENDEGHCICTIDYDADQDALFHLTEVYPVEGEAHEVASPDEMIFLAQNFSSRPADITKKLLCEVVLSLCRKVKGRDKKARG